MHHRIPRAWNLGGFLPIATRESSILRAVMCYELM
nr:MAG TPA: hypothetical protein [Caudoviricetes sp.]